MSGAALWVAALLALAPCSYTSQLHHSVQGPVFIDIHLRVLGVSAEAARALNARLNADLGNAEIDLQNAATPHVTLYLTAFSCEDAVALAEEAGHSAPALPCRERIAAAVAEITRAFGQCEVSLTAPYAAGNFAMMNVSNSPCLQRASDMLVNATHRFSQPNQRAPDWVYALPEPLRSEKLRLVALYGSPNVFSQFDPHLSLAWGPDAASVAAAIEALPAAPPSVFVGEIVALGSVGPHGTVLQGQDLAVYNLSRPGDAACRDAHLARAECDADEIRS